MRDRVNVPGMLEFVKGQLVEAVQLARQSKAEEAAVIRNEYAEHVGEEQLGSKRLQQRHPWLFPTANSIDHRRSRLTQRGHSRKPAMRVVDLLLGIEGGGAA